MNPNMKAFIKYLIVAVCSDGGWKGATSLALLFWLGKNGGWKAG